MQGELFFVTTWEFVFYKRPKPMPRQQYGICPKMCTFLNRMYIMLIFELPL